MEIFIATPLTLRQQVNEFTYASIFFNHQSRWVNYLQKLCMSTIRHFASMVTELKVHSFCLGELIMGRTW
jgi:hypothetical protein